MKKPSVDQRLLYLLVSIYNQSIQTYYHFPEVILCGRLHLEKEEFTQLLAQEFVMVFSTDSFGKYYRLSKKGEAFLFQHTFKRRLRFSVSTIASSQSCFSFQ